MVWKNLKLFSTESERLNPDSIMKEMEAFKFDGEEGISRSEFWRDFNELRMDYIFKMPKYVRVSRFTKRGIEFEKLRMETFVPVQVHVRESGVIETYGPSVLCERAIEPLSFLGDIDPVVFGPRDFKRVMKMASDVRKVRVYGTDDDQVVEIMLFGGGLSASKELRRFRSRGKLREIHGRMELPGGVYGFTMREKNIKFFVKNAEEAQGDLEFFIDSLISQ